MLLSQLWLETKPLVCGKWNNLHSMRTLEKTQGDPGRSCLLAFGRSKCSSFLEEGIPSLDLRILLRSTKHEFRIKHL